MLRQLVNRVGAIYPPNLPTIFDASEHALVGKGKAYLKKKRPVNTHYTYPRCIQESCLCGLAHPPSVSGSCTFMAYTWTNSVRKYDKAMSILKVGMEANPSRWLSLIKHCSDESLHTPQMDELGGRCLASCSRSCDSQVLLSFFIESCVYYCMAVHDSRIHGGSSIIYTSWFVPFSS